jgi:riboflavin kinase / FMN adenylyltransferase
VIVGSFVSIVFSRERPWSGEYLATVGVFDGLHPGHWAILSSLLDEGRKTGLPTVLFTFQPRPVTIFAPATPPDELTPAPRKWRLLAEAGIDRVTILRFSREFALVEPEEFLTEVLGAGYGLKGIWIGYDFRFGHRRRGDWEMLERMGKRFGYQAHLVHEVSRDGAPVSSSRIRSCLREGRIAEAARLLGRWPDLEGTVVAGRGQGAKILVPTANLALPEGQCSPALGVYAGEVEWEGKWRPAVMNFGRRPTVTSGEQVVPEVHLLDFEGDLRGRRLLFRLRDRLRAESKFNNTNELVEQVGRDIAATRLLAKKWTDSETGLALPPDC